MLILRNKITSQGNFLIKNFIGKWREEDRAEKEMDILRLEKH
jgi:hypothetical protein